MTVQGTTAGMGAPAWMVSTPTTASARPSGQVVLGGSRRTCWGTRPAQRMRSRVGRAWRHLSGRKELMVPCSLTGQYCTEDVDECQLMPNACQNGGTCHNNHGGYNCVCVNGWTGEDCSENIDDCAMAACFQGATCHDRVASFYCECPHGRTGEAPSLHHLVLVAALCPSPSFPHGLHAW